jgi:hypothetical protein
MLLNIAETNKKTSGYFSGSPAWDNGITRSAPVSKIIKVLAGPTPVKTQRQLVRVDKSEERKRYCRGKVNNTRNRTRRSISFFERFIELLYSLSFITMIFWGLWSFS